MNSFNNISKQINLHLNMQSQQIYPEKQLLPKSLLKELIEEENEMKLNMNYLENQFDLMKMNERNHLPFQMTQPKRKVYSHQNVIEFNRPLMYNNQIMTSHQQPMPQNFVYNNPYNQFMMMDNNNSNNVDRFNVMGQGFSNNKFMNMDPGYEIENEYKQYGVKFIRPKKNVSSSSILDCTKRGMGINKPKKKPISSTSVIECKKIIEEDEEKDLYTFLQNLGDEFIPFLKTQKGSRSMQKFLNKITPDKINVLLENIATNFKEVMCDSYGNYFVQKLIQCCSSNQRIFILKNIQKDFLEIAINVSGTHSLQSLIEIMNMEEEEILIKKIVEPYIMRLSFNTNGTHIIQKLITCFDENNRVFLNDFIIENITQISMNVNGICVIKKFISSNKQIQLRDRILAKLESDVIEIVQDPFGNYAIQHALEVFGPKLCQSILIEIGKVKHVISLSMQKFSSNVVEKCLENIEECHFKKIILDIFNTNNFLPLLRNKYGNFVLQKAINLMDSEDKLYVKEFLTKKITINGSKEKTKFNILLELL